MNRHNDAWDLIVVGGGTAGIVAAKTAAGLGARVLLVERHKTGGDCLWTGCVPSKSILAVAHIAAIAKSGALMGITIPSVTISFPDVMNYVRSAITEIAPQDSPEALRSAGISVIHGNATFTSLTSVSIDGNAHEFVKAVIATGAAPFVPAIPGLRGSNYLTSENVWELEELPKKLVIVGAGSIGCELGQAFNRLGSEVTLIDAAERILPREDESASRLLTNQLNSEGIKVLTSTKVQNVETDALGQGLIHCELPNGEIASLAFDRILIAIGRSPRTTGLGLEDAGVEISKQGFIVTSKSLLTTNRSIWAAGDITGHPQFTHVAGIHGSTAASNAILGLSRKAETSTIPRVTFTDPEIAAVGLSTTENNSKLRILERTNSDVDRAITESRQNGTTKIIVDSRGRIVGGMTVGPRAGETLSEITLAVRLGLRTRDIASTIHPYPTYSDGLWNIAIADFRNQLMAPNVKFIVKILREFAKFKSFTLQNQRHGRKK
jgi:pyruvate/2-oxoglutarate dehydrogenase complex dihydrolipoamide dehydrogenase (E3) component